MTEKILYLNIYRKWFDAIASGKKKVEYRRVCDHWKSRLLNRDGKPKNFDYVIFRNGFQKQAPELKVEFKNLFELSHPSEMPTFGIRLGEVIYVKYQK